MNISAKIATDGPLDLSRTIGIDLVAIPLCGLKYGQP